MTSQILAPHSSVESPLHRRPAPADHLDDLRQPVSSVLAAYSQHTSSVPYWPVTSLSGSADVIMTSYGAGYGPPGLVSPWGAAAPPMSRVDRLSEMAGGGGGYGSHGVAVMPPLSAYSGGVDLKPWTTNNYVPSPPTAVSPPFHAIPRLTSTRHTPFYCITYIAL